MRNRSIRRIEREKKRGGEGLKGWWATCCEMRTKKKSDAQNKYLFQGQNREKGKRLSVFTEHAMREKSTRRNVAQSTIREESA
jgi:hypothetical protein